MCFANSLFNCLNTKTPSVYFQKFASRLFNLRADGILLGLQRTNKRRGVFQDHEVVVNALHAIEQILGALAVLVLQRNKHGPAQFAHDISQAAQKLPVIHAQLLKIRQWLVLQNRKEALDFYIQYTALKDSVFNEQAQRQLSEFQTKYETEKKEIENASLQKENEIKQLSLNKKQYQLYFVLSFATLLIIIALLILYLYLNKKKTNTLLVIKNKELAILNATKDKFFAIIAHDIKNPLSAFKRITGSIILNFENTQKEQIKPSILQLDENAKKLYNLLQNLLEWAKLQKNQVQIRKQSFSILEALSESFLPSQSIAIQKNINVNFDKDKNSLICTDLFAFTTIFRNLISNAVNYTKIGGTIDIGFITDNNKKIIEIKDNGIGLSEEDKCKLFRLDVDTNTIGASNEKGSGLGLIITKELVEKINGQIEVESEINIGSIFCVILPEK